MKILDIINVLKEQGISVKYFHRKDGGYIITNIGGVSYKGAAGNTAARQIVGAELSSARKVQLTRITTKGQRRKESIPEQLKKEVAKLQRKWKKTDRPKGEIRLQKFRERYKELGYTETIRSIQQLHRYAEGLAYDAVIDSLIEAIRDAGNRSGNDIYFEIIKDIQSVRARFKDEWIPLVYEILYEVNKGTLKIEDAREKIKLLIELNYAS